MGSQYFEFTKSSQDSPNFMLTNFDNEFAEFAGTKSDEEVCHLNTYFISFIIIFLRISIRQHLSQGSGRRLQARLSMSPLTPPAKRRC